VNKEPDRLTGPIPGIPPPSGSLGRLGIFLVRLLGAACVAAVSVILLMASFLSTYNESGEVSRFQHALGALLLLLAVASFVTAVWLVMRAVAKAFPSRDEADA
jgi:hypothetical protein